MQLWLTDAQVSTIVQHALSDAPREACGLIAGAEEHAEQVLRVANVADDPFHFYRIDNVDLERAIRDFRQKGLPLIAIYHSHPQGEPILSPTDVQQAPPLAVHHVIVGLRHSKPRLAVWRIENYRVKRVEIHIGTKPPTPSDEDGELSQAQKTAILLSAIIAFIIVLIVSLSLLPPAPIIVTATPSFP